jgi:hypothetical protein
VIAGELHFFPVLAQTWIEKILNNHIGKATDAFKGNFDFIALL